jgi:hypothetical protein
MSVGPDDGPDHHDNIVAGTRPCASLAEPGLPHGRKGRKGSRNWTVELPCTKARPCPSHRGLWAFQTGGNRPRLAAKPARLAP